MQSTSLSNSESTTQAIDLKINNKYATRFSESLSGPLKSLSFACAFGSLFVFAQSYALSLQNIQINSALGEPLDAVVMVNAAPGEQLQASCISTRPNTESGMPNIRGIQLSLSRQLSPGTIRLTTGQPVNEPMSEIVVHVECPGVPAVKRSFLIMLDPQGVIEAASNNANTRTIASQNAFTNQNPATAQTRPASSALITSSNNRVSVRSRQVTVTPGRPIDPGSNYRVINGDALSTIAARVKGRDYGTVWSWAATIQAANPHAFINGNPNELIAGSQLYVPQTLAANTLGLSVPPSNSSASSSTQATAGPVSVAAATDAMSRLSSRLSSRTDATTTESSAAQATPATLTPQTATGSIRAIQPVMVMATSFSGVSQERLRQRNRGLIQAAPDNLPNFVADGDVNQTTQAANDSAKAPVDPLPNDNQTPSETFVVKPEAASNTGGRFSFIGVLAGLGLLLGAFFAGWWLSKRRAEDELSEQLEARLNEERYRERVRSGRQDVIHERMGGAAAASGIQVTETVVETREEISETSEPADTPETAQASEFTESDLDEVIGAALEDEQSDVANETIDLNTAEPIVDNEGPMIDPAELELGNDDTHELADIDLELLERDYAAQTETNTGLEDIAAAGRGGENDFADIKPGLEFPEEVKMRREANPEFDTLEFDPRNEPLDFDIGLNTDDNDQDKTDALGLDLEEAGASIDAHLEELRQEDITAETQQLDETAEVEMASDITNDIDDLVIDSLLDDDTTAVSSTRDSEEFYHLEASSIMNVGELDFEKGPDDETNILRFRQRNIRTGTDDSSGEDD